MAGLPLFKIGVVLFKEAAKPLAARVRTYAVEHPEAKRLTMMLGRGVEGFSQRIDIMFRGHRVKELKPITDAHALTVGADTLSQTFIIGVAVFLVVFEYYRSNAAKNIETATKAAEKARRNQVKEDRMRALEARVEELSRRVEEMDQARHWPSQFLAKITGADAAVAAAGSKDPGEVRPAAAVDTHTHAGAASRHLVRRTPPPDSSHTDHHESSVLDIVRDGPPVSPLTAVSARKP